MMLRLRRSTAAALLVGAAVVTAPAPAVAASSPAVSAAAAVWTYYATYASLPACQAAGPTNAYGAKTWECRAAAGKYDLWVLI